MILLSVNKQNSFTLLELSIAVLILVSAAASSIFLFIKYASFLQISRDTDIALSDLKEHAELLRQEMDNTSAVNLGNYPQAPGHLPEEAVNVTPAISLTPIPAAYTMSVSWREESRRLRTITMNILLIRRRR